jgi:hypothetical protein
MEEQKKQDLWMCTSYDEGDMLNHKKISNQSLQPFLFPDTKIEITPKDLATSAQLYYENICGLVLSHYKKLRLTYKALYKEYQQYYSKEILAPAKRKFKVIKLDDQLFVKYDETDSDSETESETDQSDNSGSDEDESSMESEYDGSISYDESTSVSGREVSERHFNKDLNLNNGNH